MHLDGGPGVDAVVVQAADGQHGVGEGMAQGAPAEHINDVYRGSKAGIARQLTAGDFRRRP